MNVKQFLKMGISRLKEHPWLYWGLFFLFLAVIRGSLYLSHPYGVSRDAYYYATQIQKMGETGSLFTPDSPVLFVILRLLDLMIKNPLVSLKIGTALIGASIIFPAYLLSRELWGNERAALPVLIFTLNSSWAYLSQEFLKNALGLQLFLLLLAGAVALVKRKGKTVTAFWVRSIAAGIGLVILIFFTHKLVAGLSLLFLAVFLIWYVFESNRRVFWYGVMGLGVLVVTLIVTSQLSPRILHMADMVRLEGLFSSSPRIPVIAYLQRYPHSFSQGVEAVLFLFSPVLLLFTWKQTQPHSRFILLFMFGFLLILHNPFLALEGYDLAYRLFILSFLPGLILLGSSTVLLQDTGKKIVVVLILVYGMTSLFLFHDHYKKRSLRSYADYARIVPHLELETNSLLVCHQGFDHYYWYHKKARAFHFLPEEQHRDIPVYRLVHGLKKDSVKIHTPEYLDKILFIYPPYLLMRETDFQLMVSNLPPTIQAALRTWRNPHQYRPQYMLRKKEYRKWNN